MKIKGSSRIRWVRVMQDIIVGGQAIRAKNRTEVYLGFLILFGLLSAFAYWMK